jgi:hypothetical protein
MKEMVSGIRTVGVINLSTDKEIGSRIKRQLETQRAASVPEVALVNNYDVDQKTFVTETMKGFTMVQKGAGAGTYDTLTAQGDYGEQRPENEFKTRPIPGQPALVYPVASQSGSFNTSFIRGGSTAPKRYYPIIYLTSGVPPGSVVLDQ